MPQGLNPYNLNKLLGGAVRVLWAPVSAPVPTKLGDIFAQVGPNYAPVSPWLDFGAAREGSSYSRGIESEGYEIEQSTTSVIEEITGTERTLSVSIAEITPEHLQIFEEGAAITTVAASANNAAQKRMGIGSIAALTRRRVAFIARRAKGIGSDVTEPGGTVRGSFVGGVLLSCAIAAESSDIEFGRGNLSHLPVTFKAFPDSTQSAGAEDGLWFEETPGTISAT